MDNFNMPGYRLPDNLMTKEELDYRVQQIYTVTMDEDERNLLIFDLFGITNGSVPHYRCTICHKAVSGDDSVSYLGYYRTCVPCAVKKYGSLGEYFSKTTEKVKKKKQSEIIFEKNMIDSFRKEL